MSLERKRESKFEVLRSCMNDARIDEESDEVNSTDRSQHSK